MNEEDDYREHSTEELVELYRKAASEHGKANLRGDVATGNHAADRIAAIYRELRSRGLEHQRSLLPLLLSEDRGVREWAAAHSLEFEPGRGEAILIDLAKAEGMQGFNARMTLKVWHEGKLRFP